MTSIRLLFFLVLTLFVVVTNTEAQNASNSNGQQITRTDSDMRIGRVRFSGNSAVRNNTLHSIVRTQPNRELLSIPGATVWYWVNQLNSSWGESAYLLDRQVVGNDIDRIIAYYRSIGYLETSVDTIIVDFSRNRYEVSFIINEGNPSRIRTVSYSGFPSFENPQLLDRYYRRSAMARSPIDDTTFNVNRRFTYDLVGEERNNIINLLRNNGHASVQRDSVRMAVKQTAENPYELDVLFLIRPGNVYNFGDVFLSLDGPGNIDSLVRYDTVGHPRTVEPTRIFARKEDEASTRFDFLYDMLLFTPGEQYNHELYLQTIRRYQSLNMLAVRQFGLSDDGGLPDFSDVHIPVRIDMQSFPRQSLRFDIFAMQRLGFGAGTGLRYVNTNLWGSAETLEIGIKGSFENAPNVQAGFLRSFEGSIEYGLPRLTFPFTRFGNNPNFANARTIYQINLAQINQLNFNVNANLRFNLKYEVSHNQTTTSILDLIEFDWFDASPSALFRQRVENEITDPLQRERILNDFSEQFSSTVRYTLRRSTTNIVQRNTGYYNELSVEAGGTIPYLLERFIVRPGEPLQSTIPSLTLADSTLSYSRFVKVYADHRDYTSLTNNTVFAWRVFGGAAISYGMNPQLPLNRRFFAGGSNDIRGWAPLRLGPGSTGQSQATINGADIKITAYAELRQTFLRNFLSTNWQIALFADAGNIWTGPRSEFTDSKFRFNQFYQEIALGSGFGFRLDWEYVIFRVDVAYRVHDPAIEGNIRRGWFNSSNPYIHFGIGHAF